MARANTWRARAKFLAAMVILQVVHQKLFGGVPNTPEGLLMYHGSAAAADMFLIYAAAEILRGELGYKIQCLNLASMIANALGYFAYMHYVSHWFYDITMWGLCAILVYKLIRGDSNATCHFSNRVVWAAYTRGYQSNS